MLEDSNPYILAMQANESINAGTNLGLNCINKHTWLLDVRVQVHAVGFADFLNPAVGSMQCIYGGGLSSHTNFATAV